MQFSLSLAIVAIAAATVSAIPVKRDSFSGRGTFFSPNTGACGETDNDGSYIVALNKPQYGDLGAVSGWCGTQITIQNTENGKTVQAVIHDACPECPFGALDMSPAVFDSIGQASEGVIPITWWVGGGGGNNGGSSSSSSSASSSSSSSSSSQKPTPSPSTTQAPTTTTSSTSSSSSSSSAAAVATPLLGNLGTMHEIINNFADTLAQVQQAGMMSS